MKTAKESLAEFSIRILAHIQFHDYRNPVSSDELEAAFGVKERRITRAVEYLRDCGHKIGSSRGGRDELLNVDVPSGFFVARRPEEIAGTITMLRQNIQRQSERIKKLSDWGNAEPSLYQQTDVLGSPDSEAA